MYPRTLGSFARPQRLCHRALSLVADDDDHHEAWGRNIPTSRIQLRGLLSSASMPSLARTTLTHTFRSLSWVYVSITLRYNGAIGCRARARVTNVVRTRNSFHKVELWNMRTRMCGAVLRCRRTLKKETHRQARSCTRPTTYVVCRACRQRQNRQTHARACGRCVRALLTRSLRLSVRSFVAVADAAVVVCVIPYSRQTHFQQQKLRNYI